MLTPNKRLIILVWVLILVLACNAPIIGDDEPEDGDDTFVPSPPSYLTGVAIAPSKGSGEFLVTVDYFWNLKDKDFAITCTHPDPAGNPAAVTPPITQQGTKTEFRFTLTKPGTYNVQCTAAGYGNAAEVFEVSDNAPDSSGSETSPTDTPEADDFSQAALFIDGNTMVATKGDNINIFLCLPSAWNGNQETSFVVSTLGALTGHCRAVPYEYQPTIAMLSGQWNKDTGEVTFHMDAETKVNPDQEKQAKWVVILDGTGKFVSENTAKGTGNWTNTCDAHPDVSCYDLTTHKEAAGTFEWTIEFRK